MKGGKKKGRPRTIWNWMEWIRISEIRLRGFELIKGGVSKGASENDIELNEATVNETDCSNAKDKRKQDEITATPVRGSISDGGEREAEDAAATKKASERKSPAAKRSHGIQPSIMRFFI